MKVNFVAFCEMYLVQCLCVVEPAAPSKCTVNRREADIIFMSWQPPEPNDYKVVFYYVKLFVYKNFLSDMFT